MEKAGTGISIKKLLDRLTFVPEAVAAAAVEQPQLFMEAAVYRVRCMEQKVQAESLLEVQEAELALQIRRLARDGGERITELSLAQKLRLHPQLKKARQAAAEARKRDEYSKLLLEAYRMRRDSLRIVGDLLSAEIGAGRVREAGQHALREMQRKLSSRYPGMETEDA